MTISMKLSITVTSVLFLSGVGQGNPIDGAWSDWSSWSTCTRSCGYGVSFRLRNCTSPAPKDGGLPCNGTIKDIRHCNNITCPDDDNFTTWSSWTSCDQTCGDGKMFRFRDCADTNGDGLKACIGDKTDMTTCNNGSCPTDDDVFTTWSSWTSCDQTCGDGKMFRFRDCADTNGDRIKACNGDKTDMKTCNNSACFTGNDRFSTWTSWSSCGMILGDCKKYRLRSCEDTNGDGHTTCVGDTIEFYTCNTGPCLTANDTLSTWTSWSSCDMTCGDGKKFRMRSCEDKNGDGQETCVGDKIEFSTCSNGPCLAGHVRNVRFVRETVPAFKTRSEDG